MNIIRCLTLSRPLLVRLSYSGIDAPRKFSPSHARTINSDSHLPWFMREQAGVVESTNTSVPSGSDPPPQRNDRVLPGGLPDHLITLHSHLSQSPLLAHSTLRICKPSSLRARNPADDLSLAYSSPKGRRRRGVHYAGETVGEPNDMWSWYVLAQVKEGTEGRGAIEAVIRSAQKELLKCHPHLPIPRKLSRKRTNDGWEVLDIGDSLLHVVSREAAHKWFLGQ